MTTGRFVAMRAAKPGPLIINSYSHRDAQFRERLEVHMAQLKREGAETWFDGDMAAGDELDPTIRRALKRADIFVALASPDYLHSTYCFEKEYLFALQKAQSKRLRVLVAIVRRCQWKHTRMAHYVALPRDGKAIEDFSHRTRAYEQIVEGIRAAVERVKTNAELSPALASTVRRAAGTEPRGIRTPATSRSAEIAKPPKAKPAEKRAAGSRARLRRNGGQRHGRARAARLPVVRRLTSRNSKASSPP